MVEKVYWKMRNGELISIDEMDVNHLRNVLKMIIRNRQKVVKPKFTLNGDMANVFNDDIENYEYEFDATEIDIY
jgi:uncharacterized protein YaaQ